MNWINSLHPQQPNWCSSQSPNYSSTMAAVVPWSCFPPNQQRSGVCLLYSLAVLWSCRGTLFFASRRRRQPLWCHRLLAVKNFRKWKPHWVLHLSCASWFTVGFFFDLSPAVVSAMLETWISCGYSIQLLMLTLLFVISQRTASLSQLPIEDIRDPLPPQWKCYMSPQGRQYYVNTTNNGKN